MRHVIDTVVGSLRRLVRRCDGNVAMLFGLCAIPAVIGAGMAIDVGRAYMVKIRLGAALDAAALAVGSESGHTQTQLQTDLQNYFTANYPSTALGTSVTVTPVPADVDLTSALINWQAQATVPMTVMQLVGVNSITVTVAAQTKKTTGLEIAVVLDNTGSMLCGADDASSHCGDDVVQADTTCTNSSNNSRICTLINAATNFVDTLTGAINSSQQLYMSIVPYVTTVNVGDSFCTGSTSCSHITTTSGKFTDLRGNMMPVTPITGNTTSGSTISSVSFWGNGSWVSGTAAIQPGMNIYGPGIPSGATVSSVSSSSITISSNATLTQSGALLAVGPSAASVTASAQIGVMGPTATTPVPPVTGTWTTGNTTVTSLSSTGGIAVGMFIAGCTSTAETSCALFPSGDTVGSISGSSLTLSSSTKPTTAETGKPLFISNVKGTASSGSKNITSVGFASGATDCAGNALKISSIVPGMLVSGPGIPQSTSSPNLVAAASGTTITLSANATTGATSNEPLVFINQGGNTTLNSTTITCVSIPGLTALPAVGTIITGNGIPTNTTITGTGSSTTAQYAAGTGTLTISNPATATNNTELNLVAPLTYNSNYNTASPAGSSTTANWGGCVIEPTSSGENASGTGVIATSGNPDTSEPTTGANWYPYYWVKDSANNWSSGSVSRQDTTTELQGGISSEWLTQDGPNQGCPVSLLPLTDATNSAGKTAVLNKISSMWVRDAGGTQVHVGMAWGWRALSPTGPFTAVNGHPLSYSNATTTGWKKVVVLMTDGNEQWPATDNMTGLGQLADGKIGTSSSTSTAVTNLDTRLATTCSNMAAQGYIIYTIGLGNNGSTNTELQNCAANGGFFEAATPTNLLNVFNDIARSLIALRLSQ